jgi:hypothetical protein
MIKSTDDLIKTAHLSKKFIGLILIPIVGNAAEHATACTYMHWIRDKPTNVNLFGLGSKDTYATLRLENGVEISTKDGFTGSWPEAVVTWGGIRREE